MTHFRKFRPPRYMKRKLRFMFGNRGKGSRWPRVTAVTCIKSSRDWEENRYSTISGICLIRTVQPASDTFHERPQQQICQLLQRKRKRKTRSFQKRELSMCAVVVPVVSLGTPVFG